MNRASVHAARALEEYLDQENANPIWGMRLLQHVYRQLHAMAADPRTRLLLADRDEPVCATGWAQEWERARHLNNRAWRAYEVTDSIDNLKAALEDARASLELWPHYLVHRDTEVRLLLRLGRDDEAFRLVRWVDTIAPGWRDLDDVRKSGVYRAWLAAHAHVDFARAA